MRPARGRHANGVGDERDQPVADLQDFAGRIRHDAGDDADLGIAVDYRQADELIAEQLALLELHGGDQGPAAQCLRRHGDR